MSAQSTITATRISSSKRPLRLSWVKKLVRRTVDKNLDDDSDLDNSEVKSTNSSFENFKGVLAGIFERGSWSSSRTVIDDSDDINETDIPSLTKSADRPPPEYSILRNSSTGSMVRNTGSGMPVRSADIQPIEKRVRFVLLTADGMPVPVADSDKGHSNCSSYASDSVPTGNLNGFLLEHTCTTLDSSVNDSRKETNEPESQPVKGGGIKIKPLFCTCGIRKDVAGHQPEQL